MNTNGDDTLEGKVLKREITPEVQKSRMKDVEEVLDNYRDNLYNRGVTDEEVIERFIAQEREKMYEEFNSLDNGDVSSNIYHIPTDWQNTADNMKEKEIEEDNGMER